MRSSIAVLAGLSTAVLALPQISTNARLRSLRRDARLQARAEDEWTNESWAGAVVTDFESGETIKSVNTTFSLPTPSVPSSTDGTTGNEFTTSAWVGIDGYNCNNLWQAGVDSTVETTGETSYYAWYEWYPAGTQVIDIGSLSAGDEIYVSIIAESANKGNVTLNNISTGKTFTKVVTSSDTLCLTAAEWIIEDVSAEDDTAGVANIGNFTFEAAYAKTNKRTLTPAGAQIMDIVDDSNTKLTTTTVVSDTVVVNVI